MPTKKKRKKRKRAGRKRTSTATRGRHKKHELELALHVLTYKKAATIERIEKKDDDDSPKTGNYPGPRLR